MILKPWSITTKIPREYEAAAWDKYFKLKPNDHSLTNISYLKVVMNALSTTNLEGKVILDLGCGSRCSEDNLGLMSGEFLFEPWFCRLLHKLGAHPIGVDLRIEDEEFEHYSIDLYEPYSLKPFYGRNIDIVTAFSLFDSPSLEKKYGSFSGEKLFPRLKYQLEKILKKEGIFFFETLCSGYEV